MKKLILILLFSSINIYSQYGNNFPVKQITFFDQGVSHPQFFRTSDYFSNQLLFELHSDTSINIGLLHYDVQKDTFYDPVMLTENSGRNINPFGVAFHNNTKLVVYQTNIKGTWDIAYKEFKNGIWYAPKILTDPTGDETNPSIISQDYFFAPDSQKILFEKDSSIFMLTKKDSSIEMDTLLAKSDSLGYTQLTGLSESIYTNYTWHEKIHCVVKQTDKNNKSVLIDVVFQDRARTSIDTIIDSDEANNPQFIIADYPMLEFEDKLNNFNDVYFIPNYPNPGIGIEALFDKPVGDVSSFNSVFLPAIITKSRVRKINDRSFFSPYTFKLKRNDSTFIRTYNYDYSYYYSPADSMIYTKVDNNKPAVAGVGSLSNWQVYYYVWEDSANGKIIFKGKKDLETFGAVDDITIPKGFYLYQNYPNPFNPSTVIKFYLPRNNNVKLIIYNVLGEKAKTLVDKYMLSGEHKVEFLPVNMASGVYFYQLIAGKYSSVKKMVFLK